MANQLLFSNNAGTTLQTGISSSATTVTLAPGSGGLFPNPGAGQYFVGTFTDSSTGLINEIVWVTARSGDVLTIVRAQEGTTALAWNSGDMFENLWTAGQAAAIFSQISPSTLTLALGMVGTISFSAYAETDGALKLIADGRSLLRAGTYARLFAAIGTTWGSVDSTHFNIPTAEDCALMGSNLGSNLPDSQPVGTLKADQMQGTAIAALNGGGSSQGLAGFTDRTTLQFNVLPTTDGTHGTPRLGFTTRPRAIYGHFMIYY